MRNESNARGCSLLFLARGDHRYRASVVVIASTEKQYRATSSVFISCRPLRRKSAYLTRPALAYMLSATPPLLEYLNIPGERRCCTDCVPRRVVGFGATAVAQCTAAIRGLPYLYSSMARYQL